jgi:hypothetical protein
VHDSRLTASVALRILLTHTQRRRPVAHKQKIKVKHSSVKSFYLQRKFLDQPVRTLNLCSTACTIRRPYQASMLLNYFEMKWHSFIVCEVFELWCVKDHKTGRSESQISQTATANRNWVVDLRIFQTVYFYFMFVFTFFNPLKTNCVRFYIRIQRVPCCKHSPPLL